jgi:hypothetical protein
MIDDEHLIRITDSTLKTRRYVGEHSLFPAACVAFVSQRNEAWQNNTFFSNEKGSHSAKALRYSSLIKMV